MGSPRGVWDASGDLLMQKNKKIATAWGIKEKDPFRGVFGTSKDEPFRVVLETLHGSSFDVPKRTLNGSSFLNNRGA